MNAAAKPKHVYLVDGSGFIFRAFHALPPLTRADGTPVNAVLGFTNMLMKLLARDRRRSYRRRSSMPRASTFRNDLCRLQGAPARAAGRAAAAIRR